MVQTPSTNRSASAALARSRPPEPADASAAVAMLLDRHGSRIHALASRLCGNRTDAEDLVQDVFLQAFRKWHTFRGESDPGTWLYAIAVRACRSRHRRRAGKDPRTPPASQLMPWNETTVMRLAAKPGAESEPERREAIARVQAEIARLPEHLRVPLVLKEVLEMPVEEVASALGLAANTVKTRLHRGRLALRKAMTARSAAIEAPLPIYEKQICLDLLKAKLESMDRGRDAAGFKVPQAEVCARCRAVFRELDLVQDACAQLSAGEMPPALRKAILAAITRRDAAERAASPPVRRGRRPVARSGAKAPR